MNPPRFDADHPPPRIRPTVPAIERDDVPWVVDENDGQAALPGGEAPAPVWSPTDPDEVVEERLLREERPLSCAEARTEPAPFPEPFVEPGRIEGGLGALAMAQPPPIAPEVVVAPGPLGGGPQVPERVPPSKALSASQSPSGDGGRVITREAPPEAAAAANPWPDITPISPDDPPRMTADLFPQPLRAFAEELADCIEVPVELPLMTGLGAYSAALMRKAEIELRSDHREPLNTYCLVSLPSGTRKSEVAKWAYGPIFDYERKCVAAAQPEINRVVSRRKTEEHCIAKMREELAKTKKTGSDLEAAMQEIESRELALPPIPVHPRLVCQDITPEALASQLSQQDERLAIFSDEGGFLETLFGIRYGKQGNNIDLVLQAFNGSQIRVDRKDPSKPPINLQAPLLTINSTVQPTVLKTLANMQDTRERGLFARFVLLQPPNPIGSRTHDRPAIREQVVDRNRQNLLYLLDQKVPKNEHGEPAPRILKFAPTGRLILRTFEQSLEIRMPIGGDLYALNDFGSKLTAQVARIAAILHIIETGSFDPLEVPDRVVNAAVSLGEIFIAHALAVHGFVGRSQKIEDAILVFGWIKTKHLRSFKRSECFQALQHTFGRKDRMEAALKCLEENNYIRQPESPKESRTKRGRPAEKWEVNPALLLDVSREQAGA